MKELHHGEGTFFVDNSVAEALERLGAALSEAKMSAVVRLVPPAETESIEVTIGLNLMSGRDHVIRARPFSGEPSHLGLDDL
jgi:hypothetical protein